jgi:hypothetical protein
MAVIEIAKIQVRRGQESVTGVPRLDPGEFGWAQDTQHLYIGKRIAEGANSDENSRILTDKDLENIFDLLGVGLTGSSASTSTYRYRASLPFEHFASTTTTIGRKLDNSVSLTDFTQGPVDGDITSLLKLAIENLYSNNYLGTDTIRILEIPAGEFVISGVVDLPPFATLVGEGAGVTTLVINSGGQSMFRTVDKLGAHYSQGMQYNSNVSQNIKLSNMTLAYSQGSHNDSPLVLLDNTKNPIIENVRFTTKNADFSTPTFVNTGTAVAIRNNIGTDESTLVSIEAKLNNCQFDSMEKAITTVGLVSHPAIDNNLFLNLHQGIDFTSTSTATAIVSNPLVTNNKFIFITDSAIKTSPNFNSTNVISRENSYYYVGNGNALPDNSITYQSFPVLDFNTLGNASINDFFNRKETATTPPFYYNPLVSKNAKIIDDKVEQVIIPNSTNDASIIKIPLTGIDQLVTLEYNLRNALMSRKGRLTVNISPDGFASVSDYYNYSEISSNESTLLVFSTNMSKSPYEAGVGGLNYVTITCSNFSTATSTLEYSIDITV